ncbi:MULTISPECIES: type III-B CRISPR module-associated protein Cmr5 [unclassified Meiothermus]|uniref:type III-B CRISPR module-associated protein Cmr5 n=1 Tax=unclassified Meiothermus TaxID=370471 RepID=UPI000D7BE363|nr:MULTISPECIES: type III-B CRISPR module-associated protein Cmr5 [unclassified Meiothermus]PZA07712.1 type III-B CRISPR module-associated protein Cmr5 [Meiothermus sp. Pnk-1]RYM34474.1 type III-B CRISPR module-associated protein Cmr5 [Meiothermus sp. PNK-Is4]
MSLVTRAQEDMELALKLVSQVEEDFKDNKGTGTKGRYQALCQEFPVMVRTSGLCQAIAFSEAKKGDEEGLPRAHKLLLNHVEKILGSGNGSILEKIRKASAIEYMHMTRRVLDSWVYFKRFSKSVLTVED